MGTAGHLTVAQAIKHYLVDEGLFRGGERDQKTGASPG